VRPGRRRRRVAVIVEGIPDYLSTNAEGYLQDLMTACAQAGNCVIAEGDTSQLGSSWPLLQAVKVARHGIILQADQSDGDAVLRTELPRPLDRRPERPGGGRAGRHAGHHRRSGRPQGVGAAEATFDGAKGLITDVLTKVG
jgi:S-DNA-T family DNA segregation ATPase FtsK/SpoIIIE